MPLFRLLGTARGQTIQWVYIVEPIQWSCFVDLVTSCKPTKKNRDALAFAKKTSSNQEQKLSLHVAYETQHKFSESGLLLGLLKNKADQVFKCSANFIGFFVQVAHRGSLCDKSWTSESMLQKSSIDASENFDPNSLVRKGSVPRPLYIGPGNWARSEAWEKIDQTG